MRICIVSPELVKKSWKFKIKNLKKIMRQNQINVDAVCTKHPKLWK